MELTAGVRTNVPEIFGAQLPERRRRVANIFDTRKRAKRFSYSSSDGRREVLSRASMVGMRTAVVPHVTQVEASPRNARPFRLAVTFLSGTLGYPAAP